MDNEDRAITKGWIEHWRRVGPLLEQIRRQELREFDYQKNWQMVDALLQIGCDFATPRTTSGLVELQRRLQRLRQ